MSTPTFSYPGVQLNYAVGTPLTIAPVQTGDAPSPRLRVSTVSGNSNNSNYPVDGLPNVATYKLPNSVASKADGTLAVVDDWSNTVRIINTAGVSSTLAGKYEVIGGVLQNGFADGQGAAARFWSPKAVAFDANGNVIVLDTYNFRVRQITPSGLVTTLSGSGVKGLLDGNATTAQFSLLNSLWIDNAGNIFVTDNYRVRKVTPSGDVTTIAGSAVKGNVNGNGVSASFRCMRGITGDNAGNLYVSDTDNGTIRKIDSLGNVSTLISGIKPTGIVYNNGLLYVADNVFSQILVVNIATGTYTVYAGSGVSQFKDGFDTRTGRTAAAFYAPEGLAVGSSGANLVVYVADKNSMKIRKIDSANYSVTPALPNGLSLDPVSGVISGTPTQATPLTSFNIVAGNTSGFGTTTIGFKIN